MEILNHFKNVSELNAAIREARMAAENEAIKATGGKGCLRSRGAHVKTLDASGEILQGEAESWDFGGKASDFDDLANLLRYGNLHRIVIEGGFDHADSVRAMNDHDHDPWVSEWEVEFGFKIPNFFSFNEGGYYVWAGKASATIGKVGGRSHAIPKGYAWYDRVAEASSLAEVKGYHDELEALL